MRTVQKNKNDMAPIQNPEKEIDPMDDHETNGHLRTLMDAEMIKANPDKMAKVHALVGRHDKAITSIKDLKDTYQQKYGPKKKAPMTVDPDMPLGKALKKSKPSKAAVGPSDNDGDE